VIADAARALAQALEAQSLRVALRPGDITPPAVYLHIGALTDSAPYVALTGGLGVTFWAYIIPVRGVEDLMAHADLLDRFYAGAGPLTVEALPATWSSVTVNADTWPAYRAEVVMLTDLAALTAQKELAP